MRKILLTIQYNGKNFCGWQVQDNERTVQGTIESALKTVLGEEVKLVASGRTDSGVHAYAQTAHFMTSSNFDIKKLVPAINGNLPNDVSILKAKQVKEDFHARFDVKQKTYMYQVYASEVMLPLYDDTHTQVSPKVLEHYEEMKKASEYLVGKHNFKAFCSSGSATVDFDRTIYELKIKKQGSFIEFTITGSGFLYNMVRIIVGTLLEVGEGKRTAEEIPEILASEDRTKAGKTMSGKSLFLVEVKY